MDCTTTYKDRDFQGEFPLHGQVSSAQFHNVTFSNMAIKDVMFYSCHFLNCAFINCSFEGSNFNLTCRLYHVVFRNCDLKGQDFFHLGLETTTFEGTSLIDVQLWSVRGDDSQIKTLLYEGDNYIIRYTTDSIQIGCESHLISEWRLFSDRDILKMDGRGGLTWWKANKERIFEAIADDPAEPTITST